ncbi:MAG: Rrf2 family transcriptional regulator [Candidatus Omnitrophica bacterium]|nr:Rrf2 family transcriptional regulator [Candidatus Omnitrophota bacterium]
MRVSTRTRYGMRLMMQLAAVYDNHQVFLKDIARAENVSEKYLSQIVIPLRVSGLINSFRGAHGGYALARSPAQITLREIVVALEGNLYLLNCAKTPERCDRSSACVTRALWNELGEMIAGWLEMKTLADLMNHAFCCAAEENSYVI